MRRSRFFLLVVAFLVSLSVILGTTGCPPARRPLPRTRTTTPAPVPRTATPAPAPAPNTTTPSPGPVKKPLPTSPSEMSRLTKKLDSEAEMVPGVKRAFTVISGTTAFVGVELKKGTAGTTGGTTGGTRAQGNKVGNTGATAANANSIKAKVAARLRQAEPRLTSANVTAAPDLVSRISKVSRGVQKGTPLTSFSTEMAEITRRVTPTTR